MMTWQSSLPRLLALPSPFVGNCAKLNEKIKKVIIHVFKSAGKQHPIRLFDLTSR
jgi:hypothetical protein